MATQEPGESTKLSSTPIRVRPRRAGSSLGGHPRGDTGVGSLATLGSLATAAKQLEKQKTGAPKTQSTLSNFLRWSSKNTWVWPLVVMLAVLAVYFVDPGEHNPVRPAIFLSYPNPALIERTNTLPAHIGNVTQYGKGKKDFAFVAFFIVFFTFTREFLMQTVIRPIALYYGIRNANKQARFLEQFYTAIYFAVFGPFGLWVMSRTPVWYFNTTGMYEGFPHRAHESYFKAYYLLQAAYWAQQAIVLLLMLEKPRKDFKELVLHHAVTVSLIYLSYAFHFTYMGIAIYITHDVSDFFLATVKILNYIDSPFTPPYYAFFMVVWAYLRHFINLTVLWSMRNGGEFMTIGRYDLSWPEQQYKCLLSRSITFGLLATLQAVNCFWFFLICRIAYRLVFKGVQKDERSDDEEDGDDAEREKPTVLVNGEPVSASGVDLKGATKRR